MSISDLWSNNKNVKVAAIFKFKMLATVRHLPQMVLFSYNV